MKIITGTTVYVQKNDIRLLTHADLEIPGSIFMEVFGNGVVIIDDSNRWEFVKFEGKDEIEFFRQLDWIIDYNEVKDLNEDEFIERGCAVAEKKKEIAKIYNGMSEKERKENYDLVLKCKILDHKMYSLRDILWFKQGHLEMDLPLIPDENGFCFTGTTDCNYQISASIDPNKLLLSRKDGNRLTNSDRIPQGFIESGMSIAITEKEKKDNFYGDYKTKKYLSEDNKYLVIEFKVKNYDEKIQENMEQETISKKLVKKIKTIFKK